MSLTDPELDLLQELLADDPGDLVFVQVGEELTRRGDFERARDVLRAGLELNPDEADAWRSLTRAALECAAYEESLRAWTNAGPEHQRDPDFERLRILALERSGQIDRARQAIERFEQNHGGNDVVVEAARERIDAPPPPVCLATPDPFVTVGNAERYAAIGRPDRALRLYRRLLFHHPGNVSLRARIEQLTGDESRLDDFTDLSEELADPNLAPPVLTMPQPGITSASVKPAPRRDAVPSPGGFPTAQPTPNVDRIDDAMLYSAPVNAGDAPAPAVDDEPAAEELPDVEIEIEVEPAVEDLPDVEIEIEVEPTLEAHPAEADDDFALEALPAEEDDDFALEALPAEEDDDFALEALPAEGDDDFAIEALPAEEDDDFALETLPDDDSEEVLAALPDDGGVPIDLDRRPSTATPPPALRAFMADARQAVRASDEDEDEDEDADDDVEELPGLDVMGLKPKKRRKRRSLLKKR